VPRSSKAKAEDEARAILSAALGGYRSDVFALAEARAAEGRVLSELRGLEERTCRHPPDREAMQTARSFARLARLYLPRPDEHNRSTRLTYSRLVELAVTCREISDRSGTIERTVDITPLLADLKNPKAWSLSHGRLFAAYHEERMRAGFAALNQHGPCDARAAFERVLKARARERNDRCRPTDIERIAGLVLPRR
jgi:hypothetical protein